MSDSSETNACLYALDLLSPFDRAEFEAKLKADPSLDTLTSNLGDSLTDLVAEQLAGAPWSQLSPSESLKQNILASVANSPISIAALLNLNADEGFVVSDAAGRIQWVNEAFTDMCGYSLEELKGKRPGRVLRGEGTDPVIGDYFTENIRRNHPCSGEILNYHKDGTPYFVALTITPIMDGDQSPRAFIAIERELKDDPRLTLVA